MTSIPDYMIPADFCKNKNTINFTTDNMTSNFELLSKNEMDALYITRSMWTDWLQTSDEKWYESNTPQSGYFDIWPDWLFQYYNELSLGDDI